MKPRVCNPFETLHKSLLARVEAATDDMTRHVLTEQARLIRLCAAGHFGTEWADVRRIARRLLIDTGAGFYRDAATWFYSPRQREEFRLKSELYLALAKELDSAF